MVLSPTKACKPEGLVLGFTDISAVHVLVHQPEGNGVVTHQSLQTHFAVTLPMYTLISTVY